MTRRIKGADLFCGAGGTSTGMAEAAEELGFTLDLTAVNHWEVAIETHSRNHPAARHFCASLDSINPTDLFGEDEVDILWASPECTHHSVARGGKPINDQSRATAWCVARWAEKLRPKAILVENVKEFLNWGPIGTNGKPLATKRGDIFRCWIKALEAIGYRVEWRILCAADYGDPTTRRRLIVYAVRGRRKIIWPEPSHTPLEEWDLFGNRKPWVSARDVIDWSLPGRSIYGRKKPLAANTIDRIMKGWNEFGLKPFIIPQQAGGSPAHSVDIPISTITTSGAHALAQPFIIVIDHKSGTGQVSSIDTPLSTVTTKQRHGIGQPYIIKYNSTGISYSVDRPLDTVTTKDRFGLCQPEIQIDGEKYFVDILFRMLNPGELAAAQGFPKGYRFAGKTKQVVKQIGNAVPKNMAKALAKSALMNL